jgi:hypothetical protein
LVLHRKHSQVRLLLVLVVLGVVLRLCRVLAQHLETHP